MDDLKALVGALVQLNDDNLAKTVIDNNDVQQCLSEFWSMLNADSASVVRCKDCINSDVTDRGRRYCSAPLGMYACMPVCDDDFCSCGEKKDGGG